MKKYILSMLVVCCPSVYAANIGVTYEHDNYKEIDNADSVSLSTKISPNNFFETILADVQLKRWDMKNSALSKDGITGNLVGYYNLGKQQKVLGVSQLQLADSNLFPKATFYQEFSYKTASKDNLLLGAGMGVQSYYDDKDTDTFFKIGPVYYFNGGAIGYKYGEYTDSKATQHSVFANYNLTDKLQAEGVYNSGKGSWDYLSNAVLSKANVKSSDASLKLTYQLDNKIGLNGGIGRTVVKDKSTDKTSLSSNNIKVGLTYNW